MAKSNQLTRDEQTVRAAKLKAAIMNYLSARKAQQFNQADLEDVDEVREILTEYRNPSYNTYPVLADMVLKGQIFAEKREMKNWYSAVSHKVNEEAVASALQAKKAKVKSTTDTKGIKIDYVQSTGRIRITAPAGVTFDFGVVQS